MTLIIHSFPKGLQGFNAQSLIRHQLGLGQENEKKTEIKEKHID